MAHIAFTTIPYGGHVNPTLAVASELVARGHRVSYAVTEEFSARVAAAGAHPVPVGTTMKTAEPAVVAAEDPGRYNTADLTRLLHLLLTETVATLPQLARAFLADPPDLLVHDTSSWAGELLAAKWGIPGVASHVMFASGGHWSVDAAHSFDPDDADLRAVVTGISRLGHRLKVPVDPGKLCAGISADPTLVYLPKAFQPHADGFPDRVHFVGPCLAERSFHGRWRPPPGGARVVLVALGSTYTAQPRFYRDCVDAFADSSWHAVIAIGAHLEPERLGALPVNVEVHRFVAQLDVLSHASVFISHAGMGSVMESLSLGVPIVAVPQIAEQRANAERLVELGLGTLLDRAGLSPERLRRAAEATAGDAGMRARIDAMRQEIRAAGGAAAAADHIERALAGRLATVSAPRA
jgi:demethyllactenocin mycarosyltransferase